MTPHLPPEIPNLLLPSNVRITCTIVTTFGISDQLKIWKVSACKIGPQSGIIFRGKLECGFAQLYLLFLFLINFKPSAADS